MKILSFILAMMILVLSCIPCSDAGVVAVERAQQGSAIQALHYSEEHPDHSHEDLCSPFCQCSCCAVAYALPVTAFLELARKQDPADKPVSSYLQPSPAGVAFAVWQPPRLV